MKNKIHMLIIVSIFILFPSPAVAQISLTAEPEMGTRVDWDLSNDGLLHVNYDLDHDGRVDFCAWRIVKTSFFSKDHRDQVADHHSGRLVFAVQYTESSYFYIAVKEPMLYGMDVDQDGLWDFIYKDPMQDGVNGNEIIHFRRAGMKESLPNS